MIVLLFCTSTIGLLTYVLNVCVTVRDITTGECKEIDLDRRIKHTNIVFNSLTEQYTGLSHFVFKRVSSGLLLSMEPLRPVIHAVAESRVVQDKMQSPTWCDDVGTVLVLSDDQLSYTLTWSSGYTEHAIPYSDVLSHSEEIKQYKNMMMYSVIFNGMVALPNDTIQTLSVLSSRTCIVSLINRLLKKRYYTYTSLDTSDIVTKVSGQVYQVNNVVIDHQTTHYALQQLKSASAGQTTPTPCEEVESRTSRL